jgi:cytochrome d ubiquinol oxidase subunit I
MDYPIWDVTIGGGMLMALVAIPHVIVSHFAIGGGLLIAVTETLAVKRGDWEMRELARRSSLVLILVSTVFGAISGVGIWVVAGLISPGAISALIHTYVWGWAIEWVFFILEIVAALVYYTTWDKISKGAHVLVGWLYFVGAFFSLVVINGIITYMLTPGRWLETQAFWDGFFNPTYFPALVLRTGICAMMATAFLVFAAQKADPGAKPRLIRYLGWWMVAGALISYAGYRWWEAALPDTVLGLFRGDSPVLPTLAATRSLTLWALTAALVLAAVVLVARPRYGRAVAAIAVMVAAFLFFGSYERLREGVRKPFLIHSHMFSNGLLISDIERINERGMAAHSGWVAASVDEGLEAVGRQIFKAQCSICHTLDGYQAIRPLLPTTADLLAVAADSPAGAGAVAFDAECASCHEDLTYEEMREIVPTPGDIRDDPEFIRELNQGMIYATLVELHEMGEFYVAADRTQIINTHDSAYPQMPPLVGSDGDVEALAAYLASLEGDETVATRMARLGGER